MNDARYIELAQKWGDRSLAVLETRQHKRAAAFLGCSKDEAKAFGKRLLAEYAGVEGLNSVRGNSSYNYDPEPNLVPELEPVAATEPDDAPGRGKLEHQYAHDTPYWHDPKRDVYVVWLPHLSKPIALPAQTWAGIKAAYSGWDGQPASVEEIARKFGLTRRTVTALMRVMGHTHTGSPWTREQVMASDDRTLVEDLVLAREERVLREAEQTRWEAVKQKAEAFELLQRGCLDALNAWLVAPQKKREPIALDPANLYDVNTVAVIGLTDLHFGELGHNAELALRKSVARLVAMWKVRGAPSRIVLPIGSDGMHFDTAGYTTSAGTRMEASGAARETVVGYMGLMADLIGLLAGIAPVYCLPMAGNHDRLMSYATFAAMRLAFRGDDRVTFSGSLSEVQVLTHGKAFIALHHGDRHKPTALAGILPRDFAVQWGETEYRYCLLGHYHTPGTFGTKSGIECVYMPSLAPTDEWTEGMGFRSQPALSVYTFDPEVGLTTVDTVRGT